jgi:hypothetical protein
VRRDLLMKILHIFPYGGLILDYYQRFIKDYFGLDSHHFMIIGKDNTYHYFNNDIKLIQYDGYKGNIRRIIRLFSRYDKIIYHGLSIPSLVKLLFLFTPAIMNKIGWVSWGYDSYQWKIKNRDLKSEIDNIINYVFRKRIKFFVGIFPPDIDFYKKEFKSNARTFYAPYPGDLYNPIFRKNFNDAGLNKKTDGKSCVNIQIGHSSTQILNHIDVLDQLFKYKDKDIKIYIPLSYGNVKYGDEVEQYAKKLFGDKVFAIRKFMNLHEYMNFLEKIDISIFNTTRQIGLGNIHPLLYMGKKIFIPYDSVMYNFFRSQGIDITDYKQIMNMEFCDFIKPVDMQHAKNYIGKYINNSDLRVAQWNEVFNAELTR